MATNNLLKSFLNFSHLGSSKNYKRPATNSLHGIERMLRRLEILARHFIITNSLIYFFLAASVWVTVDFSAGLRMLSVSSLVSIAATAVGGALGFLFGIPRVLQNLPSVDKTATANNDPSRTAAAKQAGASFFSTNTSLEEISDWLTKIIIGLSLVQFDNILAYINTASIYSASFVDRTAIAKEPVASFTSACFFAIILSSIFLSCLYFYLQTRTRITILFQEMEAYTRLGISQQVIDDVLKSPIANVVGDVANGATQANPVTQNDLKVLSADRHELKTAKEIAAWAAALARNNDLQGAESALLNAVQLEPDNVDILMRLAEVRRLNNASGFVDTVVNMLQKAKARPDVVDMGKQGQLEALYLPPPRGFLKAIEISDLLAGTTLENDPYYHLRKACAYGQQYSFEQERAAADDEVILENAKRKALDSLNKVKELMPDPDAPVRREMKRLLTTSAATDDDLKGLAALPEFQVML